MIVPLRIAERGGPADVCYHGDDLLVVWQDGAGADVRLIVRAYDRQALRVRWSLSWHLGSDVGAFPRLLSALGSWWLIYREGASLGGRAVLRRDGVEVWRSPVECGGNDCVCLGESYVVPEDPSDASVALFAYQATPDNAIFVRDVLGLVGDGTPWRVARKNGRPTGLSHFDEGDIVLVDAARAAVPSMTRPSWAGALVCGEHPDAGVLVQAADGRQAHIWPDEHAVTPRLAHDPQTGAYAVVTSGVRGGVDYGVRLATFTDADLAAPAPPPSETWDAAGTVVDCGRFFDIIGSTVPREAADGQVWQAIRLIADGELRIVKGADPRFVEILRLTDDDVRLAYDATDGRYPRAWRLDVVGDGRSDAKWCPTIGVVGGWRAEYPNARLIRRSENGPSTVEDFPYAVAVEAHGRHVDYGGDVGVIDAVLVTSFTPHAGKTADGYTERHHWAVKSGRAIGLVRYTEVRNGKTAREFTFNRYAPNRSVPLSSLIVHPIPDPPSTPPKPPTPPMPTLIPRDQFADALVAVNDFYASEAGLQREGGMVIDGRADVQAMIQWGYDLAAGMPVPLVLSRIRQSDEWKTKHPVTAPTDPPEPTPDPVPSDLAPIRIAGTRFSVDIREIGGFTLYDQWLLYGPDVMAYYPRQVRAVGGNTIRVMLGLGGSDWWRARSYQGRAVTVNALTDTYYDNLGAFVRWLASFGCYTRVCFLGDLGFGGPIPDRGNHYTETVRTWAEAHCARVARMLVGVTDLCLGEVANEYNQIGFGSDASAIRALARVIHAANQSLLLSGSNENGPNADTPTFVSGFDYVDSHLDRRRGFGGYEWVKRSSESPVVDNGDIPFHSGEPINFGSNAPGRPDGHDNERSPAVALCYAGTSRMKRYSTNFHCEAALDCEAFDEATLACALAWRDGLDLIPWNPEAQWRNGHWPESPFDLVNFPSKTDSEETWPRVVRLFGRSDGYWVSVAQRRGYEPVFKAGRSARVLARIEHGDYECRVWKE